MPSSICRPPAASGPVRTVRKPTRRLSLCAKASFDGWVGGGCTRSTVLREARRAIADGEPRLLSLSPAPGEEQRPGLVALPMTCDSGGTVEIYVEPVLPVARLVLFGSSPAVRVLAR